jgi:hypothetical protein
LGSEVTIMWTRVATTLRRTSLATSSSHAMTLLFLPPPSKAFNRTFKERLDQESSRFDFADLYYYLLGEWTGGRGKPMEQSEHKNEDLDGSFEHVQKYDLQKLKEKFASVAFAPLKTDEVDIGNYLSGLFEDDYAQKLLEGIRNANRTFADQLRQKNVAIQQRNTSRPYSTTACSTTMRRKNSRT